MNKAGRWGAALAGLALLGLALGAAAETPEKESVKEKIKPSHIDLVLVLDKSGSMSGLEDDTIGGFNSMLEKQRQLDVATDVTTVLFSDQYKVVHERESIKNIEPMTAKDYTPGGMTALLDAVGRTIGKVQDYSKIDAKDNKVIFVIITDGKENYSKEYKKAQVKKLIEKKQENSEWEFVFLGANIDAATEAGSLGIVRDHAVKYRNTPSGVRANYDAVARFAAEAAAPTEAHESNWKEAVEEDK